MTAPDDFRAIHLAIQAAIGALSAARAVTTQTDRNYEPITEAVVGLADASGRLEGLRREHEARGTWITWLESLRAASLRRQRSAGSRSLVTGQTRFDGTVLDLRGRK